MSPESNNHIFEILRTKGLLSSSTQRVIHGFMERWGVDAFRALIETNVVEESKMADILADALKLPRLRRVPGMEVTPEIFNFIPYNSALELVVFPLEIPSGVDRLRIAFADPSDLQKIRKVEEISGKRVEIFVGERTEIIAAIQRHYPLTLQLPSLLSAKNGTGGGTT